MRTETNNKKSVIKVLRGESAFTEIYYKGILFKYCCNNITYRECFEYIKEKIQDNNISY